MFTATRVAAITAVLALGGTLALVSSPLAPTPPVAPPGAEAPATDVSLAPAPFTGTALFTAGPLIGTSTELDDRVENRDVRFDFRVEADDPRVDGAAGTTLSVWDDFLVAPVTMQALRDGDGRLENDDGAWAISAVGGASVPENGHSYVFWSMVGEGGYEGLVGSMIFTDHSGAGGWQVQGWIFPEEASHPD